MEEHALVVVIVVLVCDLLLAVGVPLPQLLVDHLLDLRGGQGGVSAGSLPHWEQW